MSLRSFTSLALFLAVATASASPDEAASLGKRSALLESRQTCPTAGWIPACPGFFACVPPGAICCSDNISYAMPPDTCPDGTQPVATAIVSSSPPSTITTPPVATQTLLPSTYYSFTITWYYWYYYFTYIEIDAATVTTSYQVTTLTTVSVQATDENQATSLLHTLTATLAFPTPTQAATSLSGVPGPATTAPSSTMSLAAASSTPSTSTTTSVGTTSAAATTTALQFTGAASSLRTSSMVRLVGAEWAMAALIVVPGLLMVWL